MTARHDGPSRPTVLVVQHEDGCPPDRLGDGLREAGVRLEVCRPYAGDRVPDRVDADGLLVLGGHMGAGDDVEAPWLPATRALLRAAVADAVPVLGVCLGGQLLAAACGGRVQVGRHGLEAGVLDLEWLPAAADDPLFGGRAWVGPSMHHDEIAELPPGAVWLARSGTYPHQAFRLGPRAWGLQFHPEVSVPTFRCWAQRAAADAAGAAPGGAGADGAAPAPTSASPPSSGPGLAASLTAALAARDEEVGSAARALAGRFAALVADARTDRQPVAASPAHAGGAAAGPQVTRR